MEAETETVLCILCLNLAQLSSEHLRRTIFFFCWTLVTSLDRGILHKWKRVTSYPIWSLLQQILCGKERKSGQRPACVSNERSAWPLVYIQPLTEEGENLLGFISSLCQNVQHLFGKHLPREIIQRKVLILSTSMPIFALWIMYNKQFSPLGSVDRPKSKEI